VSTSARPLAQASLAATGVAPGASIRPARAIAHRHPWKQHRRRAAPRDPGKAAPRGARRSADYTRRCLRARGWAPWSSRSVAIAPRAARARYRRCFRGRRAGDRRSARPASPPPCSTRSRCSSAARRPPGPAPPRSVTVWMLAEPELLFNRNLGAGDHLALLLALAGGGRTVVFDEHVHGVRDEAASCSLARLGAGPGAARPARWPVRGLSGARGHGGPAGRSMGRPESGSVELVDRCHALLGAPFARRSAAALPHPPVARDRAAPRVGEKRAEAVLREYAA